MRGLSSFMGWTLPDDKDPENGPSKWSATSGALLQNNKIESGNISSDVNRLGTFALY